MDYCMIAFFFCRCATVFFFFFDPEFTVFVDGEKIEFQNNITPIKSEEIKLKLKSSIKLSIYQIPDGKCQ